MKKMPKSKSLDYLNLYIKNLMILKCKENAKIWVVGFFEYIYKKILIILKYGENVKILIIWLCEYAYKNYKYENSN